MYKIQLNATGTHHLEVEDCYFETIAKYKLFKSLIDSNGYVDEGVLDKLKLNIRSIISNNTDCTDLLDLCIDIIYHNKMKSYGLHQLILAYVDWTHKQESTVE